MYTKDDFKVGQELFVALRRSTVVTIKTTLPVTKVGRKWLTLGAGWGEERADIETLVLDGGDYMSPGKAYLSQEAYESETRLQEGWSAAWGRINRKMATPKGLTDELLNELGRVLDAILGEGE